MDIISVKGTNNTECQRRAIKGNKANDLTRPMDRRERWEDEQRSLALWATVAR